MCKIGALKLAIEIFISEQSKYLMTSCVFLFNNGFTVSVFKYYCKSHFPIDFKIKNSNNEW